MGPDVDCAEVNGLQANGLYIRKNMYGTKFCHLDLSTTCDRLNKIMGK
jgi:hypothetical protein